MGIRRKQRQGFIGRKDLLYGRPGIDLSVGFDLYRPGFSVTKVPQNKLFTGVGIQVDWQAHHESRGELSLDNAPHMALVER